MDTIGMVVAALLTVMVLSYIIGDNPLFKVATHLFVGVAVGYATLVVWYEVFMPLLTTPNPLVTIPALGLALLLLLKTASPQNASFQTLGSLTLAFVLGVGAALAISGALFGTLMPQVAATASISLNPFAYPGASSDEMIANWLSAIIIVIGTIGTFFYFTFAVRAQGVLGGLREGVVRFWAGMGRFVLIFTLAALFANTVSARVALLVSRLDFLAGLFGS